MYLRRRVFAKYFIVVTIGTALYCEWFIHLVQPLYWQALECHDEDPTCIKILFIADPQIQGDVAVNPPLSYLFNWDSDRYLKSTFSVAMKHFRPDVLVYLGDLMDEGSISTMVQFHSYVKRLSNIFDVDYPVVQVWVPGDNDIGGENESIKRDKVIEFDRVFSQPPIIAFRNISFYKVNGITHNYPQLSKETENNFNIVVSHYPITGKPVFGKEVNNAIHPKIYFCAHDHDSKYMKQNVDLTHRSGHHHIKDGDDVLNITFDGTSLYEIYVPTCSYRMGTQHIGYGAAILENNNQHMRYTVFWSSPRFLILFIYLAILALIGSYVLIYCVSKFFVQLTRRTTIKNNDRLPLLEHI